jgi:hypothetical protein
MKKNLVILLIGVFPVLFHSKPVFAQVSVGFTISANIPPPPLPVYTQPPCPVDGYLWCPGYWAYSDDGYFWVPGVWVLPPRYGYLWTPPYWGFEAGVYGFHPGYWGPYVGFYGGINYGYGYGGSGFGGGRWVGNKFMYNTAVVRVNRAVIHNTYIDKTVIVNHSTANNRRISFNGGPGGLTVRPSAREQAAFKDSRLQSTAEQNAHLQQARANKLQFASVNHGHPATVAMNKPLSHIEHEQGRPPTEQRTSNMPVKNYPEHNQAVNNHHVGSINNHAEKANRQPAYRRPAAPHHYVPLTQPLPAPNEGRVHSNPNEGRGHSNPNDFSRQEHANPQMQQLPSQDKLRQERANPQMQHPQEQDHSVPQQQSQRAQQPRSALEPHNPSPHNPEKPKER